MNETEQKIYLLLEEDSQTLEDIQQFSDMDKIGDIVKALQKFFQECLLDTNDKGDFNHKQMNNIYITFKNILSFCSSNEIYHSLKSFRNLRNKIMGLDSDKKQELQKECDDIITLLLHQLPSDENQYYFLRKLIDEVRNISYLGQILNTYPQYANVRNPEGKHIVLELIDKLLGKLKKGTNAETIYLDHVITLIVEKSSFYLETEEINHYCALLRKKQKATFPNSKKNSYYQALLDKLLDAEVTISTIRMLNKKYNIVTTPLSVIYQEVNQLLKKTPIITIDSKDTLDMDDALSVTKEADCYHVKVYIADVDKYVKPGTALDREALRKSETIYLSDQTIVMLEERLSNDIISLNTFAPKRVLVYQFDVYQNGDIANFHVALDDITIDRKLDYATVNRILKRGNTDAIGLEIQRLSEVASILRTHGPDKTLYRTIDDLRNREIYTTKNLYHKRTGAEIIVEEIMVHVNYLLAKEFFQKGYPFLYRNHLTPDNKADIQRLNQFKQWIEQAYQDKERYIKMVDALLKMYPSAYYDLNNEGHFGLGLSCYSHATAPLRRYPDIVVSRLVKDYILSTPTKQLDQEWVPTIQKVASYCNERMDQNALYQSEYERMKTFIKMK